MSDQNTSLVLAIEGIKKEGVEAFRDKLLERIEKLRPEVSMRADLWWDGYDDALTDVVDAINDIT